MKLTFSDDGKLTIFGFQQSIDRGKTMRIEKTRLTIVGCILALLALAPIASAQERRVEKQATTLEPDVIFERRVPEGIAPANGFTFTFLDGTWTQAQGQFERTVVIGTGGVIGGKTVKGVPYSAQAITENIQILSDGNRIVHRSTASIFRDSEGRTRREDSINALGPFGQVSDEVRSIIINDPVSGVSYLLDTQSHTARKLQVYITSNTPFANAASGGGAFARTVTVAPDATLRATAAPSARAATPVVVLPSIIEYERSSDSSSKAKTESLGRKTIEGVEADGERTTVTIPAGQIGNEMPIDIVSERWFSPDLQTVIMTRHNDPRNGENIYRLTNISRTEPAKSLFEVPADYQISETNGSEMRMKLQKEVKKTTPEPARP
jgi:hypothetical protein